MAVAGGSRPAPTEGHELAWRNRRLIAERTGWPDGAVDACERIEAVHRGWYPNWNPANAHFGTPEGYYAARRNPNRGERLAYGATPKDLLAAIRAVVSDCPACGVRFPIPAGSDIPVHEAKEGVPCRVHWSRVTVEGQPPATCADVPPGTVVFGVS